MSDDLVQRLRDIARRRARTNDPGGSSPEAVTEWVAADEIERLRGALAEAGATIDITFCTSWSKCRSGLL